MIEFILKVLDLFKWFFRFLGVDYEKFRILLWVKLTVDNRQEKSLVQRKSKKEMSNSMLRVTIIYALMGIFLGAMLLGIQSVFTSMIFVFSMVMVMTAVALISDFTSVLLDTTDNAILLPRPIDSRTLATARITHIVIYILMITLSLTTASIVIGTIKFGPLFTIVFIAALFFAVLFVVFLANVFYLLLLKISSEDHFRDIILYFQIFMAAFAMGSYQLLPRLMEIDALKGFTLSIQWWTYLIPPAWMAAPIDIAVNGDFFTAKIVMSLTGLVIPIVCVYVVIKYLAPGFSTALSQMEGSGSSTKKYLAAQKKGRFQDFLSRIFTTNVIERSIFQLSWKLSSRDRKFKLRTYPTFGYMLIIAFVLSVYRGEGNILENIQNLPSTGKYLIFLYVACIVIPIIVHQQKFSDQYEAAWIYYAFPFASPGDIQKGSLKAMVVKYGFSAFIPLSLFVLLVWGPHVLDDIVLAFLSMIIASVFIGIMVRKDLPFSRKASSAVESQKSMTGVLLFLFPACLGGIHYGLTLLPYAIPIAIIIALGLAYLMLKLFGQTTWKMIV
ncbi:MAG: hypothetical protein MUP98_01925 [Candidatus Aminicenantes bacterium]|nr:hypothetical protein [Candidatus Aminicenantes bacterium]